MTTDGHFIAIDSISYYARLEGGNEKPLVILCHALMANNSMWDATAPALHQAGFSTLRFDHVGHNLTTFTSPEAASKPYHFDDFILHIHTIVQKLLPGKIPFAFIGCSIGGVLALRYAQMYPGTLTKVISCDAPGLSTIQAAKPLWTSRIAQFKADGVENLAKATVDRWFPEPCLDGVREGMLEQTQSCTFEGYQACAKAVLNYDYFSGLKDMKKEHVLVLAGENDSAIGPREILVNVAKEIPSAEYVLMKSVGHIPPYHDPDGFNKIMLEFLRSRKSTPSEL